MPSAKTNSTGQQHTDMQKLVERPLSRADRDKIFATPLWQAAMDKLLDDQLQTLRDGKKLAPTVSRA